MSVAIFFICILIFCKRVLVVLTYLSSMSNVVAGTSQWLAVFHRPLELRDIINTELQYHALHTIYNSDLSSFVCYQSDSKNSISTCWSRCEYKSVKSVLNVKSILPHVFEMLLNSFKSQDFGSYLNKRFTC